MDQYNHKDIEKKWQDFWEKEGIYKTRQDSDKSCYVLDMFPYPSGSGLHVGHPRGYIASDVFSRLKRMQGFNVLHPMGWDAFGLPAENHAIQNKTHPSIQMAKNIDRFKEQLQMLGPDYDWSHEINTTDSEFYKWTQWQFLKMYKAGLAYQSFAPINWCPSCQTGLANEDLDADGTCERCGSVVEKKPMRQWILGITKYADRLLEDLDTLDQWPEWVKEAQRNWIGRSQGAKITFPIVFGEKKSSLDIFTTRPDTLFGATYMVIAPEHPLIHQLEEHITNLDEVKNYVLLASKKSEIERTAVGKEKTGVRLQGVQAINPANNEQVPVFVADYVLAHYGTGAIMAVPAHDERDFAFAKKYDLPIHSVVESLDVNTGPGNDAYIPGVEEVERENVVCIIEHPSEDKFLCADWKQVEWRGFVTGGLDGNDPSIAAVEEVKEETGYQNLEVVKVYDTQSHGRFYHVVKKQNRLAHYQIVHIKLHDLEKVTTTKEEQDIADFVWVDGDKVEKFLMREDMKFPWRIFRDPDYVFTEEGLLTNSGKFTGMSSEDAKAAITEFVGGEMISTYRLNDWVFSRQRYWGEPIPVVHSADGNVHPVAESDLPVALPDVETYAPTGTGESPLADILDWVNVTGYLNAEGEFVQADIAPTGSTLESFKRETNTMPQWAGSSWYWIRYIDPNNKDRFIDSDLEKKWLPANVYVGGDHATRHLIYARFWYKFLFDQGLVSTNEPFPRLEFLGHILAEDGTKISKRKNNGEDPAVVVDRVGADALRVFEMFIGPFEKHVPWSNDGLVGSRRFVERVWRLGAQAESAPVSGDSEAKVVLHKTIKKVTSDIQSFKFNTAISQLMILANAFEDAPEIYKSEFSIFLKLLAPFAPHVTEELWHRLGNNSSIHLESWPDYDENLTHDKVVTIGVQVNGKVRAELTIDAETSEDQVRELVLKLDNVTKWIEGQDIQKFIYIPGRIINIIV